MQILQVMSGGPEHTLRSPRISEALEALEAHGVVPGDEFRPLVDSYYFMRHLINGLRMLRGSAKDLFLPDKDSPEYEHLARRMGCRLRSGLTASRQLHADFETHTALVRSFVKDHLGPKALPGASIGNIADMVLSVEPDEERAKQVLEKRGFTDAGRALRNLRALAGVAGPSTAQFARLAILAGDVLGHTPDPDMALNNWERFVHATGNPVEHFERLSAQPRRLEVLLAILSGSQFLADTLIRSPDLFEWVTDAEILNSPRPASALRPDLEGMASARGERRDWLNTIRRFRQREILRIGTRDICLQKPIDDITQDLSSLAEVITDAALDRIWESRPQKTGREELRQGLCIMAFGKLGARELNYSSDIDLLALCGDQFDDKARGELVTVMQSLVVDLTDHTEELSAYRVDLKLRPYGHSGQLVHPFGVLLDYFQNEAELWELQALLKFRPVAGNTRLGWSFLSHVQPVLRQARERSAVVDAIRENRERVLSRIGPTKVDTHIKAGRGSIREIEFLAQGLQLIHTVEFPQLFEGNTVEALNLLRSTGILPGEVARALIDDYAFMRRVEHFLQLLEDRQIHALPESSKAREALAKRVLGSQSTVAEFLARLKETQDRIRAVYDEYL